MSCNLPADRAAYRPAGGKGTADFAGFVAGIGHIRRLEMAMDTDMSYLADRGRKELGLVHHSGFGKEVEDEMDSVAHN